MMILPLAELLKTSDESEVNIFLSTFRCSRDKDYEDFLREKSIAFEKRWLSRTYLITNDLGDEILAYFSIGLKCANIKDQDNISRNLKDEMNIEPKSGVAQSYLIGQVSRSDLSQSGLGMEAINCAIDRIADAAKIVGCRMIRVDCKDELIPYYKRKGFKLIGKNPTQDLNQLVYILKEAEN